MRSISVPATTLKLSTQEWLSYEVLTHCTQLSDNPTIRPSFPRIHRLSNIFRQQNNTSYGQTLHYCSEMSQRSHLHQGSNISKAGPVQLRELRTRGPLLGEDIEKSLYRKKFATGNGTWKGTCIEEKSTTKWDEVRAMCCLISYSTELTLHTMGVRADCTHPVSVMGQMWFPM